MAPKFLGGNVHANCPDCNGAITSFEFRLGGAEHGAVINGLRNTPNLGSRVFGQVHYHLLRCAGCGRGGLATVWVDNQGYPNGLLKDFFPRTVDSLKLPEVVPPGVKAEFQEAELCASVGAWRAGSALLRSTLEKGLRANGYEKGSLAERIDEAAADGIITAARSKRAHDDIRVLGNDVLHDDWREVAQDEFDQTHHYAQRILEDLYDDRPSVESLLREKGRMKAE